MRWKGEIIHKFLRILNRNLPLPLLYPLTSTYLNSTFSSRREGGRKKNVICPSFNFLLFELLVVDLLASIRLQFLTRTATLVKKLWRFLALIRASGIWGGNTLAPKHARDLQAKRQKCKGVKRASKQCIFHLLSLEICLTLMFRQDKMLEALQDSGSRETLGRLWKNILRRQSILIQP